MSWRIGISSGSCADWPILDLLPVLQASGAKGIELGTPPHHFDPWQDHQVAAVGAFLDRTSLQAVSIHAPFGGILDLADANPHHRHAAIGAILTAAHAIKRLGGQLVVVHPSDLERNGQDVGARLADSARSLALLSENCRLTGLTLVLETPLPHLIGGHPDEFAWILNRIDHSARVCLDTGHTALGRSWHRFLDIAGSRLVHVHASDNRGHWDDHLPPGDGTIDWREIVRTLQAADYSGWIMLELQRPRDDAAGYFKRAFERATIVLAGAPQGAAS
ncbi:MAG: sugar phosphate isomerase/epimerase family protein [Vicinamibacterales bacterium]